MYKIKRRRSQVNENRAEYLIDNWSIVRSVCKSSGSGSG